ncbi:MAG TPA: hypothetical protein VF257_16355, partial [Solirubrobacteraceae bacterium]
CGPTAQGPDDLRAASDHQILFDRPLLLAALRDAHFVDLIDLTETTTDRHTEAWSEVVDRYSIVIEGRKRAHPS